VKKPGSSRTAWEVKKWNEDCSSGESSSGLNDRLRCGMIEQLRMNRYGMEIIRLRGGNGVDRADWA